MARILMAEDDRDTQTAARMYLAHVSGHDLTIVGNGRAAVEAALAGNFDLILMDIHMPEMDGYEAIRTLRAQGYTGMIQALTASVMADEQGHAIDAGADGVLSKPIKRGFDQEIAKILRGV